MCVGLIIMSWYLALRIDDQLLDFSYTIFVVVIVVLFWNLLWRHDEIYLLLLYRLTDKVLNCVCGDGACVPQKERLGHFRRKERIRSVALHLPIFFFSNNFLSSESANADAL